MDNETPELIEAQMAETRQSLTDKVAALEDSVVGTVQSATTAVQDTVQTVRDAVEGTVETVKDNVASALDIRRHVQSKPWAMVGSAAMAGVLTGLIVFRKTRPVREVPAAKPLMATASTPVTAAKPGLLDELFGMVGTEIKKLAETAITTASASLHRVVNDGLPKLVDQLIEPPAKEPEDSKIPTYPIGRWNGAMAMGER